MIASTFGYDIFLIERRYFDGEEERKKLSTVDNFYCFLVAMVIKGHIWQKNIKKSNKNAKKYVKIVAKF